MADAQDPLNFPARPPFQRSQSDSASVKTISADKNSTSESQRTMPVDDLPRKRHSEFVFPSDIDLDKPNIQILPQPERPPRNPARHIAQIFSPSPKTEIKAKHLGTVTGSREDVTPWELYPVPVDTRASHVRTTSKPASNSAHNLAEALVRRRKSTGSKPSKPKPPTLPMGLSASQFIHRQHDSTAKKSMSHSTTSSRDIAKTLPKSPVNPLPIPALPSKSPKLANISPTQPKHPTRSSADQHEDHFNNLKFSTADRTILEELKRNISVRGAQFVMKGPHGTEMDQHSWGAERLGSGKKHHPYPKDEVPYPRNYERNVIDLDVWETMFNQQLSDSNTWHVFESHPTRVLDIGCGSGTWILNCARTWKACQFVGLDVVPLHPDLQQVGSISLGSRITWLQHNFLEGLPFPNDEFDFIHIKRIALGVPEDKWDFLFEEITRVLKPAGAFEIIEEDLVFPGKVMDGDEKSEDLGANLRMTSSVGASEKDNSEQDNDADSFGTSSITSRRYSDELVWSPTTSMTSNSSPKLKATTSTSMSVSDSSIAEDEEGENVENGYFSDREKHEESSTITDGTIRPSRPLSGLKLPETFMAVPSGKSSQHKLTRTSPHDSASSSRGSIDPPHLPLKDTLNAAPTVISKSFSSTALDEPHRPSFMMNPMMGANGPILIPMQSFPRAPKLSTTSTPNKALNKVPVPPFVYRSLPRAPPNPRDHSLLEEIYNEMLASRFINRYPISLLGNMMSLYFKDVRTHPPLQFTFPPFFQKLPTHTESETEYTDSDPDEDARDAIIPGRHLQSFQSVERGKSLSSGASTPVMSPRLFSENGTFEDATGAQWLSINSLVHGSSPYVVLDESKSLSFSPTRSQPLQVGSQPRRGTIDGADIPLQHNTVPEPSIRSLISMSPEGDSRKSNLPNRTLHLDIRTLNLHLAIRVSEILACAETMWEWIVGYQKELRALRAEEAAKSPYRSRSADQRRSLQRRESLSDRKPSFKSMIEEMNREEFDQLLSNFEIDMHENMALGPTTQNRFDWNTFPSAPTSQRKIFDNEVDRWQKWKQDQQKQRLQKLAQKNTSSSRRPRSSSGALNSRYSSTSDVLEASLHSLDESSQTAPIPQSRKLNRSLRVYVGWKP